MTTNDDSRLPERDNEGTAGSTRSSSSMSQDFKIKLRTSTREKLEKFNALRGEFVCVWMCSWMFSYRRCVDSMFIQRYECIVNTSEPVFPAKLTQARCHY